MKDIESRIDELSESACALDQAEVLQFGEFVVHPGLSWV
jgi:hypothetical protein